MKILRKIADSRAIVTALAVGALIAAQVVVINHDLADSHTPDNVCEFCVAGAGLADANVGETEALVFVSVSLRNPNDVFRVPSNVSLRYHFARAPPTAT